MFVRLTYLVCAALATARLANSTSWTIAIPDSSSVEISAPASFTRALVVENPGTDSLQLSENLLLPDNWRAITDDESFCIPPMHKDVRLISVHVPAHCAPGLYTLHYRLSTEDDHPFQIAEIPVNVKPQYKIEVEAVCAPRRVMAGTEYQAAFAVTNCGNTDCPIRLSANGSNQNAIGLSEREWTAQPGEKRVVIASVGSESPRTAPRSSVITLDASSPYSTRTRAYASTDIVPSGGIPVDIYRRIPSVAVMRYVSDRQDGSFQAESRGAGALDAGGHYRLNYLLRGPHNLEHRMFGLRDEAFLSLHAPYGSVSVGDQMFGHSSLTERNRIGRGVQAIWESDWVAGGGYVFKPRVTAPDEQQLGLFAEGRPWPGLRLRINGVRRQLSDGQSHLLSLWGASRLRPRLTAEWETAVGWPTTQAHAASGALSGQIRSQWKRIHWVTEGVHAGQSFPGSYHNEDLLTSSLRAPLSPKLQWTGSLRWISQNRSRMFPFRVAYDEGSGRLGLDYGATQRSSLGLDAEELRRNDHNVQSSAEMSESILTGRFRHDVGSWSVQGAVGGSQFRSTANDGPRWRERLEFGASCQPLVRCNVSAKYQTGFAGISSGSRRGNALQLSASCIASRCLSIAFFFQRYDLAALSPFEHDQVSADIRWQTFRRHILSLKFRRMQYRKPEYTGGTFVLLSYEIPFDVPVGRRPGISVIRGRVLDGVHPRRGVPNLLLLMDETAVMTDENGRFQFSSVKPGSHYLQVDHSTLGERHTLLPQSPMMITARDSKTENLALTVVRSASVRGEVVLYGTAGSSNLHGLLKASGSLDSVSADSVNMLEPLNGLGGKRVEVSGGSMAYTAITDAAGRFALNDMTPGHWTIRVNRSDLPNFHTAEQDNYELDIQPGNEASVLIRIIPKTRPVLIVDEGKVPKITVSER